MLVHFHCEMRRKIWIRPFHISEWMGTCEFKTKRDRIETRCYIYFSNRDKHLEPVTWL